VIAVGTAEFPPEGPGRALTPLVLSSLGNGYVVVGDSPTNSSYQYRNASVVYRRTDDSSLPFRLHLIKIEPVTFQGFYPALLNKNLSVPYIGQNVTMAGYGYSYSLGEGAMELSVPVKYVSAGRYFKAGGDDMYTRS
jgi:hypothetical protein